MVWVLKESVPFSFAQNQRGGFVIYENLSGENQRNAPRGRCDRNRKRVACQRRHDGMVIRRGIDFQHAGRHSEDGRPHGAGNDGATLVLKIAVVFYE
jgi:hypothetical protein